MTEKWTTIGTDPRDGGVVTGVIEEIIAAIRSQARQLSDDYSEGMVGHGTGRIVRLCQLLEATVESAELRDKLHQIDNDFRERLRAVIPDWKYNPEF
jgi:hypothetical protein